MFTPGVQAGSSPALGKADAPVTVIEFSDFQCPYCRKVAPTLKELTQAYPNDVRLVFKHRIFSRHERSQPAANLAFEARKKGGDAGFFQAYDLLVAKESDALSDDDLARVAGQLGLGAPALACTKSNCHEALIKDMDREGTAAGVSGIPAMFVNGRAISGAQPLENFRALVDWELSKLERFVEKGGARADYPSHALTYATKHAGAKLRDTERGTGKAAAPKKKLLVHYRGTLQDGTEFDSSFKRGRPLDVEIGRGRFVTGFEEGLVGMKEGGKRTVTLPPETHYGPQGKPPAIPAGSTIVFELELVSVE